MAAEAHVSPTAAPQPRMLKVLLVEPGKHPRPVEVEDELRCLQALVGGDIQAVFPWSDPVALVCDDAGKLKGYEPNRMLEGCDVLVGSFFICGLGEESFDSLPEDLIRKYTEKF